MGRMMFSFRTFALMVVHRHRAASISKTPCRTGQHLFTAGSPIVAFTIPPSTSTHAPNFTAFSGQLDEDDEDEDEDDEEDGNAVLPPGSHAHCQTDHTQCNQYCTVSHLHLFLMISGEN
ncbi:hypothetical protein SUGI_0492250 [Cryptomeria japonica]|nr:hypothetical protein SUGI_0492250 [Cryptomeria japonica]